ncbi:MAG: hypothetical protein MJZ31_09310 [Bacteroidales bacterium]|nr:hypothetical protein [Bacteroidales bacterium]
MKKIAFLLSLFIISALAQAQNMMYIHTKSGKAIEVNVEDVYEINFEQGSDKLMGNARELFNKVETPEYVDLGLSVLWATTNLGAESPTEMGNYYAWGESEPQLNNAYSWSTYLREFGCPISKYADCGTDKDPLKAYINGGEKYDLNNGIAGSEFDVATIILGEQWHMPTVSEFKELSNFDNCTWKYVQNYNDVEGLNGFIIVSKIEGYKGASIFMPCAGSINDGNTSDGSLYYWTACPSEFSKGGAQDFRMNSSLKSTFGFLNRNNATPIRAVKNKATK